MRGADAGSDILLAHPAQQVDGGGVKAVGGGDRFGPGRDSSGLGVFGLDVFKLDVFKLDVFELDLGHRI